MTSEACIKLRMVSNFQAHGPNVKMMTYSFFFLTDISIAVVDLLQDLTDNDILNENEDTASVLVDALVIFSFFFTNTSRIYSYTVEFG